MIKINKIAIIGGGSWATALVKILSNNCSNLSWWLRSKEAVNYIASNHHNPRYLTDVQIDTGKVTPTFSLPDALVNADLVILAVPSAFLKTALSGSSSTDFSNKIVFSAIKGIIPDDLLIVGDFLHQKLSVPISNIGVITGPCHAEEVALEKLSYLTIACQKTDNARHLSNLMRCRYIMTTVSDDIYGTEYTSVIKNIIAIAGGICHGLGYGDNFQAVLVSNAIQEIKRFLNAVSPISRDINDSAYLGDLLVTAYSQFSRNRTFGNMIGKGYTVQSAQLEMNMIAEGYYAVKCICELNKKFQADIPICETVHRILYEHASPQREMKILSERMK
jgi:glycerol-3-phosphate dehydrogenase (NAD(P)+)